MCVSMSQVSRFRIQSCCERFHGWFKNNTKPQLINVRVTSSSVNRNRWIRRNMSTTTTNNSSSTAKSNVLLGLQNPFGNLQQQLSQRKDLSSLITVIVIDTETTGFDRVKGRIIEIAAQDIAGGQYSTFQTLVNPEVGILNSDCHGIWDAMVKRPEVPRMKELIPIFLRFVQNRQKPGGYVMFVAHNGKPFDYPFLINEFNRNSYEIPDNWLLLDSLPMARGHMKSLYPEVKHPKANLEILGSHYGLRRDGQAHRALSDVLLLSQVFQKLTIDLKLSLSDLVLRSHTGSDIASVMAKNAAKTKKT